MEKMVKTQDIIWKYIKAEGALVEICAKMHYFLMGYLEGQNILFEQIWSIHLPSTFWNGSLGYTKIIFFIKPAVSSMFIVQPDSCKNLFLKRIVR